MTEPRLSTVYDYSNLRLHPDGSRVYQNTTNRRPGFAQVTALDSRANWIAKDAGGSSRVLKLLRNRKKVVEKEEENVEENIDILRGLSGGGGGGGEEESGSDFEKQPEAGPSTVRGKKRKAARKTDGRTIKRRKFQMDYEYLSQNANSRSMSVEASAQVNDAGLPAEPSPDLLKCIHRFASEFYDERGQLLNISRQYRQERKLRRLAKAQRIAQGKGKRKASSSKLTSRSNSGSEGEFDELSKEDDREKRGVKRSEEGHDDVSKDDEIDEERQEMTADAKDGENMVEGDVGQEDENTKAPNTEDESQKGVRKTKKKRKPRILPPLVTDMYKVFDGSALLALGMLVQEHVAFLLTPQIPEGWNEDVKGAYSEVTPSPTEDIEDNEDRSEDDDDDKDDELDGGRIQEDVHEKDETSEGGSTDEDEDEEQDSEDEDTNDQRINEEEEEDETEAIDIAKGGGKEDDQDPPTKHIRPHNNQKTAEAMVAKTSDNDTFIGASSDEESRSQDTGNEEFI